MLYYDIAPECRLILAAIKDEGLLQAHKKKINNDLLERTLFRIKPVFKLRFSIYLKDR